MSAPAPQRLAGARRRLLERMLRAEGIEPTTSSAITAGSGDGPAPLSFGQQRLWFLHQLEPRNPAYNLTEGVRLLGRADLRSLRRAIEGVTGRHHALRTIFRTVQGRAVQVVTAPAPVALPVADLSGLPEPRRERVAARAGRRLARRAFDLEQGPLFDATVLRLDAADHVLVLRMHHAVSDGWSMGILVRELTTIYATPPGRKTGLEELAIQYTDFARWQRRRLEGEHLEALVAGSLRRLEGAPTRLELPADRPRPAVHGFAGDRVPVAIDRRTADDLETVARAGGATLYTVLVAALGILLHRCGGGEHLLVGSPVAGRDRPETEGLIGFFVNTMVRRVDLSGDPTVTELVRRVREDFLAAEELQELPFEHLIDALELPRDLSRSPLFQVMLTFQNLPPVRREVLHDLALSRFPLASGSAQFDLHFLLAEGPAGIGGILEFRTDLFEATTARRLVRHLETLLAALGRRPELPVSALAVPTAEQHQVLREWNDTARRYLGAPCLHDLLAERAARTPEAVAAVSGGRWLTYAGLHRRVTRLADRLRRLGCGPESRVAVAMERSLDLVVALWGVLHSGAAYVPLDPDYPRDRLEFMLADSRPMVLLTDSGLRDELPAPPRGVLTPADWSEPSAGAASAGLPDDLQLAYVIFTSGSTGRPKGAMVHHGAIRNRLLWMQDAYGLSSGDVVLQKTPFSFDVSVWEFFWPLMAGARLVLAEPGGHRDAGYMARLIEAERVTVMHFVPSMLQVFLEEPGVDRCGSLRLVVASGEALAPDLVAAFHRRLDGVLENLYGPTEAAVDVTSWRCDRADGAVRSVPIGRGIANTAIHLLDPSDRPAPLGMPGELCIGGANVGRGYLGRPGLTAERFVPDPFGAAGVAAAGARLYRTGDLARHLPGGEVSFLGRLDHQVKVRGFRIELGEVESALRQHPHIHEVAVVAPEDRHTGMRRLVAYVVSDGVEGVSAAELRRFSAQRLPEYMVPSFFVPLDVLPLSPNGKLDRKSLPAPEPGPRRDATEPVPPEGPVETALAEVWEEVLGVEVVGARDNFFALGGDSILSVQVLARARELGIALTLQDLFRHQTIRELAEVSRSGGAGAARPASEPFELLSEDDRERLPDGLDDAYPVSRLQAGMLFHGELEPERGVYHDIFTTHLVAPFDAELLRQAVAAVVARHPVLRTSFDLASFGEPLQLVHRSAEVPVEIGDLRHLSEDEQGRRVHAWLESEKRRGFDWGHPPLLRIQCLRRSDESFQFALSFHHAVLDGWSVSSMLTELFRDYLSRCRGERPPEPEPASLFRDFVALERRALAAEESRSYWQGVIADGSYTALPRWRIGGDAPAAPGPGVHEVPLPGELSRRLDEVARGLGVPVKSVLLAGHCRLLAELSGVREVVTGLISNARPEERGSERVLGLFLNTLPFRLPVETVSWSDLARGVFEAERRMLPHRYFPLAELQRQAGGRQLFEPVFGYVHFHVLRGVADFEEIASLGGEYFEQTNFTFLANFSKDPFHGRIRLRLEYDPREFPAEQVEALARAYEDVLGALVAAPDAAHAGFSVGDGSGRVATPGGLRQGEAPVPPPRSGSGDHVSPRNRTEATIAEIWAEVLGLDDVSVERHFLELGGHSLLAMQVVSRVRRAFDVELPLRAFYEAGTVAGLAVAVLTSQAEAAEEGLLAELLAEVEAVPQPRALVPEEVPGEVPGEVPDE